MNDRKTVLNLKEIATFRPFQLPSPPKFAGGSLILIQEHTGEGFGKVV